MGKKREETLSFITTDAVGNITIKAEYRVNKKEKPTIRTATEH